MLTIRDALAWASRRLEINGIASCALDARILLRHALGYSDLDVARGTTSLSEEQDATFRELISRRAQSEPVAYIIGKKEFMGLEFAVDQRVLVPRPETELLVEKTLALFGSTYGSAPPPTTVLSDESHPLIADIGTGSGAIAVSLSKHLPRATVYATDISADALAVAQESSVAHDVAGRIVFIQGHFLQTLPRPVHAIVCNPPYIPQEEITGLERDVRDYEPTVALSGGTDGLDAYRSIIPDLSTYLLPGGFALFEIGFDQAAALRALAARHLPGARVDVYQDLAGFDRVVQVSQVVPADPEN
ncbi:MAG: peptide chain release factor N(5)-glutamine methyltransferase [Chloroflexi bacterium]|nr:peptide chain release factor N(5)-glutamine methyltransferase [Chloroflexota bacterium]